MVTAAQNTSSASVGFDDWICPVAAQIVKSIDVSIPIFDKEERKPSNIERNIIAVLGKSKGVSNEYPSAMKDSASFKLVEFRRSIP